MSDTAAVTPHDDRIVWVESNLDFFKRYDGPHMTSDIKLGNHPLRKLLKRQFEFMSRNIYFISAFGRYLLGYEQEDVIAKAEDIAQATIQNAIKSMSSRIARAEHVLGEAGITDKVVYGRIQTMTLPITSPGAKMYAELLEKTDYFYSLNSLLWFYGYLTNKERFNQEAEARKEVKNVVQGVASQFSYIQKKTRARNATVAAQAGNHSDAKEKLMTADALDAIDAELVSHGMLANVAKSEIATATTPEKTPRKPATTTEAPAAAAV